MIMKLFYTQPLVSFSNATAKVMLILTVFTGSFLGVYCGFAAGDTLILLVRDAFSGAVSTVSGICCTLVFFLALLPAWSWGKPILLIPVCFAKTFSFSFFLAGVFAAFGCGGWLAALLLMPGSVVSLPMILYWSLRQLNGFRTDAAREYITLAVVLLGVALLDQWFIRPFLTDYISH